MIISNLSNIILGTMRLAERNINLIDCVKIFDTAIDKGINTFHISSEYNSFSLVTSAFKQLAPRKINSNVVVKLASPHFDELCFSQSNLEKKIDYILQQTGLETIHIAQWMWRQNPLNDSTRIEDLEAQAEEIKLCFHNIIKKGKVLEFACFPYTTSFMKSVTSLGISKVHINYQNFWENMLVDGGLHDYSIALRPFLAGKVNGLHPEFIKQLNTIEERSIISHSLNYVLSHPQICSSVVGINTLEQLEEIISVRKSISKNIDIFDKYQSILKNNPYLI